MNALDKSTMTQNNCAIGASRDEVRSSICDSPSQVKVLGDEEDDNNDSRAKGLCSTARREQHSAQQESFNSQMGSRRLQHDTFPDLMHLYVPARLHRMRSTRIGKDSQKTGADHMGSQKHNKDRKSTRG